MAVRRRRGDHEEWEVYALAAGPLPSRLRVSGRSLRVFTVGPIAVIAGALRPESRSTEETLRAQHALILALAERVDPLLPARFGSRTTVAGLDALIRPSLTTLLDALEHVRGRRQMTVRLTGPPAVEPPRTDSTTGTAYLVQRRAAAHALPPEAASLRVAVNRFVIDERVQPGRGPIRATVFHLIAQGDVPGYRQAVEDVAASSALKPWSAAISGPWPPFAFAPELMT
jgi:gas vesicle protein GvpL/GvpF